MIPDLISRLTNEQKHELAMFDISAQRLSDWKHERRRPTAAQLKTLAIVIGTDSQPLLQWLAEQEATPAQRGLFRRVMEAASANALGALIAPAVAVILSATLAPKSAYATSTYAHNSQVSAIYIVAHLPGSAELIRLKAAAGSPRSVCFACADVSSRP